MSSYRRPLKRRPTYGRGTKQYRRTVYRRAYYDRRRQVGRKEKKGCDVSFSTTQVPNTTGTNDCIFLMNGIQEGVGSWNRIGRYIWNKSIELDMNFQWSSSYSATDTTIFAGSWLRCMLVWDKQPNNAAIPTFDTIFGQTDQAGVESTSVSDHLRYDNMFRFKVLMDETINPTITNATTSTATSPSTAGLSATTYIRMHKFLKLGNKMTNFSGTANPMTNLNISTGSLYLVVRANTQVALTDFWTVMNNSAARLRYVD